MGSGKNTKWKVCNFVNIYSHQTTLPGQQSVIKSKK